MLFNPLTSNELSSIRLIAGLVQAHAETNTYSEVSSSPGGEDTGEGGQYTDMQQTELDHGTQRRFVVGRGLY
jgi:hypothetical protein